MDELEQCRFLERLRERAIQENTPLHLIYIEEEINYHEVAIHLGGYTSVRRLMQRARTSGTPRIPRNLNDVNESLVDPRYFLHIIFMHVTE